MREDEREKLRALPGCDLKNANHPKLHKTAIEWARACENCADIIIAHQRREAASETLKAVWPYAQHSPDCAILKMPFNDDKCSCGFDATVTVLLPDDRILPGSPPATLAPSSVERSYCCVDMRLSEIEAPKWKCDACGKTILLSRRTRVHVKVLDS